MDTLIASRVHIVRLVENACVAGSTPPSLAGGRGERNEQQLTARSHGFDVAGK